MANEDEAKRTTSAAKETDPQRQIQSDVKAKDDFNRAANPPLEAAGERGRDSGPSGGGPPSSAPQHAQEPQGSDHVRRSGHKNDMPVPPGMRRPQDPKTHDERNALDQKATEDRNKRLEIAKKTQTRLDQGDRGRVRDGRDI